MRYTTLAFVLAALLASTSVYAQQAAAPPAAPATTQPADTPAAKPDATAPAANLDDQSNADSQLSPRFIRQLQAKLRIEGFLDKKPDGDWDDDTTQALADFQEAEGMDASGQVDLTTLRALGLNKRWEIVQNEPEEQTAQADNQQQAQATTEDASDDQDEDHQAVMISTDVAHQLIVNAFQKGFSEGLSVGFRQEKEYMTPPK